MSRGSAEFLMEALVSLSFLVEAQDEGYAFWTGSKDRENDELRNNEPSIVCEPNFEMVTKPWISLDQGIYVACVADLVTYDISSRFELSQHSFARCLNFGIDPAEALTTLSQMSGQRMPENIRFSLQSWIRDLSGIRLYRGTVLLVEEDRRHLVEHAESMKPFIRKVLGPGILLLSDHNADRLPGALEQAGISPVPPVTIDDSEEEEDESTHFIFESRGSRVSALVPRLEQPNGRRIRRQKATGLNEEIEHRLTAAGFPGDLYDELKAKVKKKLILFPTQLRPARAKKEKTEARGFDYLGKVRLIEQCLSSREDLLEIIEPPQGDSPLRQLVRPEELEKKGGDLVLVAHSVPDEKQVRIKVRKIGLLRRVRGSLFAP